MRLRRPYLFVALLLAALPVGSLAAAEHPSCRLDPGLQQRLLELDPENATCAELSCLAEREKEVRALLAANPGQIWVARLVQVYEERQAMAGREALIERYRQAAETAPQDVVAQYLWGRLQVGARQEATGIDKALQLDAELPLARLALASANLGGEKPDEKAAAELIRLFIETCPSRSFEAMRQIPALPDPALWLPLFEQQRAGLGTRPPLERVLVLSRIWETEFKLRPPAEHEAAREQVKKELPALEALALTGSPLYWDALRLGTEITGGDPETIGRRRAEFFPCESEALDLAKKELRGKLGLPTGPYERGNPSPEQNRQLLAGYQAMAARCPDDPFVRLDVFFALGEEAGDQELLAAAEAASAAFVAKRGTMLTPRPMMLSVVQNLVDRKVAPAKVLAMLEATRFDIDLFAARRKGGKAPNPEVEARMNSMMSGTEGYYAALEARLRLRLGEVAKAGELLKLAHERLLPAVPTMPASLLEPYTAARQELLAAAPEFAAPPELAIPAPPSADESNFKTVDQEFEGFPLDDPKGKTWLQKDLAGKTWLVNLWATWCAPCMAELPHIQKLHEELRDRPDVGVLTLNFDFEAGKVQPFLERKGYSFPVLLAGKKLEKYIKEGIPQNWLVDLGGKVKRKSTGFDPLNPDEFLKDVKEGLEQLKAK